MGTNLFKAMVLSWSGKLTWDKKELKKACTLLLAICKKNGGEINPDSATDDETETRFAMQRTAEVLNKFVAPYAAALRSKYSIPRFSAPTGKPINPLLPELVSHQWINCVDVNTDDIDTLSTLPGIDRKLAARIIKYRIKKGNFTSLAQLSKIRGKNVVNVDAIRFRAYCPTPEQKGGIPQALSVFLNAPTFGNYVRLAFESPDSSLWRVATQENPKLEIIAELEKMLAEISSNQFTATARLHYTRASHVLQAAENARAAEKTGSNGVKQEMCGALLFDGMYLPFLTSLCSKATRSIAIMMFFMRYDESAGYVANPLIDLLISAHKKGLDVKVILDKDAPGDTTRSRLINKPAYDLFVRNGVPVVFDYEARKTHSKLIIIDDSHIITGSHNWTGGSFLAYDDTSIYIESAALATSYKQLFNAFWQEYQAVKTTTTIAEDTNEETEADLLTD